MAKTEKPDFQSPEDNENVRPPARVLQLWTEVGNRLDREQTVVWKSAVESLDQANKYLLTSKDARFFVEKYMAPFIHILAEQRPSKIGLLERTCVQDSLRLSVLIVAEDLRSHVTTQQQQSANDENTMKMTAPTECLTLEALAHVFDQNKAFYFRATDYTHTYLQYRFLRMPEVRLHYIGCFQTAGGFRLLYQYLMLHMQGSPHFPKLDMLHPILIAFDEFFNLAVERPPATPEVSAIVKEWEDDAALVANAVMKRINLMSDEDLKTLPKDQLTVVLRDLQRIFDRLITTRRSDSYEYYAFWRGLLLKLITSQSLPLKLFGWEQVGDLMKACAFHRPPPRAYVVSNAGCSFVNGVYDFAGEVTEDGQCNPYGEVTYVRKIPETEAEGGGKKLTLLRCTMRLQQKWWFLSEADWEEPGTDRDIDYYQHKSKEHEEDLPPSTGWITCPSVRSVGINPPPVLEPKGVLVPDGAEFDTLEHQLAKWAIENEIVKRVLGDTTIHREVRVGSTVLIKFLLSMCSRDQLVSGQGTALNEAAPKQAAVVKEMEDNVVRFANAVIQHINLTSDEDLKKIPTDQLKLVLRDLQRIFDRLITTRRSDSYEYYAFWRGLVLKFIASQSLPLKLFGWEQFSDLMEACTDHRPPPRAFAVSNAGCSFVNGIYDFAGEVTEDGYHKPDCEVSYVRKIPETEAEGGGKKLTLFRCTMRSQRKWWFLSEADEGQPGTDRDIDYYQHKSKEHEEDLPPLTGWMTCLSGGSAGVDPPPFLAPKGVLIPEGAEFDTLEHQLAKWAIENEIVKRVLGDTTIHREVLVRSTVLIKFLLSMCSRDQLVSGQGTALKEAAIQADRKAVEAKIALEGDDCCPVCFEPILVSDSVVFDCAHRLHADCWMDWTAHCILADRTPSCPTCRNKAYPRF